MSFSLLKEWLQKMCRLVGLFEKRHAFDRYRSDATNWISGCMTISVNGCRLLNSPNYCPNHQMRYRLKCAFLFLSLFLSIFKRSYFFQQPNSFKTNSAQSICSCAFRWLTQRVKVLCFALPVNLFWCTKQNRIITRGKSHIIETVFISTLLFSPLCVLCGAKTRVKRDSKRGFCFATKISNELYKHRQRSTSRIVCVYRVFDWFFFSSALFFVR